MKVDINGMAHVVLTVSDFPRARAFYASLLPAFGMKPVFDGPKFTYFVGARTAIGIEPCDPAYQGERLVQQRVGLHHLPPSVPMTMRHRAPRSLGLRAQETDSWSCPTRV
jgi:catechol 2,3-dioxygenase-like lactoylglutathione lyase family enzyme